MRQIARAQNMDITGDSPYNPINGADSTPKLALMKAGRGQLGGPITPSPYSPMSNAYLPNSSLGYGKGTLHERGAGRPVRSNHAIMDLASPSNRAKRCYPQAAATQIVPPD